MVVRLLRRLFKMARLRFDPNRTKSTSANALMQWPRMIRRAFSDPLVPHGRTGVVAWHRRSEDQ